MPEAVTEGRRHRQMEIFTIILIVIAAAIALPVAVGLLAMFFIVLSVRLG